MPDRSEHTEGQWAAGGGSGGDGGGKRKPEKVADYGQVIWAQARGADGNAGVDATVVRDWLAAQRIDVGKLPGGRVPTWVRWLEACPDSWAQIDGKNQRTRAPAIVALTMGPVQAGKSELAPGAAGQAGEGFTGVWCGFPGSGGKLERERREGNGKAEGFCRLATQVPGGVLIVTEELTTALVAMIATVGRVKGGPHDGACVTAWAWLGAKGFPGVSLPRRGLGSPGLKAGCVRTVVLAAALEKGTAEILGVAANAIAERARRWGAKGLEVLVRTPSAAIAPKLVTPAGGEGDKGEAPAGDAKRVTWDDVLREYGPDAVARGLLDGVELSGEEDPDGRAGGGGGGGHGDGLVTCNDGEDRKLMPQEDLKLARMFVMDEYAPPLGEGGDRSARAGGVHWLIYLPPTGPAGAGNRGTFKRWDNQAGRWTDCPAETIDRRLRQILTPCAKARPKKNSPDGIEYVAFNPRAKTLVDIRKAIGEECLVVGAEEQDGGRFWLAPSFDNNGRPVWGQEPHERIVDHPEREGLPDPLSLMCFRNVQVSTAALAERRLEVTPPNPRLFNQVTFNHDLPVDEVRAAIEGNAWGRIYERHCGPILEYLDRQGWDDETRYAFQAYLGYLQTYDVSRKFANLCLFVGPRDSGKGTGLAIVQNAVGLQNIVATSLEQIPQKFHLASWRGKPLAVADEQQEVKWDVANSATTMLKRITGDGYLNDRGMWEAERTYRSLTRVLFAVNNAPPFADKGGSVMNRVLMLEFRKSWGRAVDPGLKRAVQACELGAVLFGMAGQIMLAAGELKQPTTSLGLKRVMELATDQFGGFIRAWLEVRQPVAGGGDELVPESEWLTLDELHEGYCDWRGVEREKARTAAFVRDLYQPLRQEGWGGELLEESPKPCLTRMRWTIAYHNRERTTDVPRGSDGPGLAYASPASGG